MGFGGTVPFIAGMDNTSQVSTQRQDHTESRSL